MKLLRLAVFGIIKFIGIIIIALVLALATLWGYFSLQFFMFCRGDYLLFVAGDLNRIPTSMIMILIVFILFGIKKRLFYRKAKHEEIIDENKESLDIEGINKFEKFFIKLVNMFLASDRKALKIFKIAKISYILVLIVVSYFGMTNYTILYPESIKVGSPIVPNGVVYNYSDIKNVNVGISRSSKKSYSPYYNVIFNDGKSTDLFGASMQENNGVRFEYILIDLDKELRTLGVVKTVDKENFTKYSERLDRDFVSRVETLFDYK